MEEGVFGYIWMICPLLLIVQGQQNNGNTASGNAMDLAMMNMNIMGQSSKCDIQPCQSVCQILNKTSGCYVCSATCNTGTGTNMNAAPLNPQMPQMQLGMSGCDSSWMQCPMFCRVNTFGCMKCTCSDSEEAHRSPIPSRITKLTEGTTKHKTEKPLLSSKGYSIYTTIFVSSKKTTKSQEIINNKASSTLIFTTPSQPTSETTPLSTKSSTRQRKIEATQFIVLNTNNALNSRSPQPQISHHPNISSSQLLNSNKNLHTTRKGILASESKDDSATLKGILVFVLTGLLLIALTVSIVFAVVWRRSVRKLKRQKSELYFIHKAYRQDSKAKLRSNEFDMDEPVYARIDNKPEVPPRTSTAVPVHPTVPHELLLRTESLLSETSPKTLEESPHDYLELIS